MSSEAIGTTRYIPDEVGKLIMIKTLSKLGRKTGKGNRWTQSSVGLIRRKQGIKLASKHQDDGILNMVQAKNYCGASDSTLMRLINANILPAKQVAPFAPYEIKQSDLDKEPVSTILKDAQENWKTHTYRRARQLINQTCSFKINHLTTRGI